MSVKYRLRLENDRVIGPFSVEEIVELFEKDYILGKEMCQQFPIGDWKQIKEFKSIFEKLEPVIIQKEQYLKHLENEAKKEEEEQQKPNAPIEVKAKKKASKAFAVKSENTQSAVKVFKEFKFQMGAKVEVDYKELEKKHRDANPESIYDEESSDDEIEKTVILHQKKNLENLDKTVVLKTTPPKEMHGEEKAPEAKPKNYFPKSEKELVVQKTDKELANEQTQFIDIHEVLPSINAQLKASEIEFEKKAKIEESEERHRQKIALEKRLKEEMEQAREEDDDEEIEEIIKDDSGHIKEIKKKKKGMSWIVAIAFVAIIYSLLENDEAPVKKGPEFINIVFPMTREYEDVNKAREEYGIGKALYAENIYSKKLEASKHFQLSVELSFDNNPSLGELLLTYTELLDNTRNEKTSANIVYKLLKVADKNVLKDATIATAAALFYGKISKPNTGINIIKNYLRLGSKPSVKLLSAYLDLLIQANDFVEARKAFEKIKAIPKKPIEVYLSLSRFLEADEKISEAEEMIEDGLKYYPKSAPLLLRIANFSLRSQAISKFDLTLKKLKEIEVEGSPAYLAEYYKYLGMQNALKDKNKEAAVYFKKSLEIKENDELRTRLATLDVSGNELAQKLILESKQIALVKKAKEEIKNKNWEQAVSLISEAVEANPEYIPAAIVQAELQINRGLYQAALNTLINIKESNPNNFQLLAILIETYLKAYKYDEAQKLLVEGAQSKFANSPEYYYLYGMFFEGKGNLVLAIKYYEEALKRNPVDDRTYFKLATILFNNKKFPDAKKRLSEALTLDPKNTEYLSLYAQIINEQDNPDTAIGYLRDIMTEVGEDPKLLSTITAIYFKSGQLKEFKTYYNKVQNIPKKDEAFYEFLIKAAKLDESYEEFETYSKELLKINPGNLKAKMTLAEYYIEKNKLNEAVNELADIKEKLPSYPKVNNMLARVYLAQGDMKEAKKMAELELKLNPNLDSAYFIVGEVYRQNKEYREAVSNFEKAISKNGKSVEALMGLGWIRLNQNLGSEALDLYTRVVKIDPTNSDAHRQLGFTYKALGQRAIAREKFEDYLKLNPGASDRPQIEQVIKNLK